MILFLHNNPYYKEMRVIRGLRVLRPLKIINAIPRMRKIFDTLIASLNQLVSVLVFLLYLFVIFGLLGTQLFQGAYHNRCRETEMPINGRWEITSRDGWETKLCDINEFAGTSCPSGLTCGNPN